MRGQSDAWPTSLAVLQLDEVVEQTSVQREFGLPIEHSSVRIDIGVGKRVFIPCSVEVAMPFEQDLARDGRIGRDSG
jgi:hypothetical protein